MAMSKIASNEISNMQSNLVLGFVRGLKFECNICKGPGEDLICSCTICKKSMHPSCAGIETGTVYDKDGRKQVVLPASEKLPKSCRDCLRKPDGIMMLNQLCVQQRSYVVSPSGSSITRFIESGMGPAHKLIEGDNFFMTHEHKPGHQLKKKDNWSNYNCSGCKIEGFGEHYECENASCSFLLHRECMYPRKIRIHEFFPNLTFAFSCLHGTSNSKHSKKAYAKLFCNGCGSEVNGYFYHSLDGTINLHSVCINLARKSTFGETGEELVLKQETTHGCYWCCERSIKVDHHLTNHIWSYAGVHDNIHLHVGCIIKMFTELKRDSMGCLISYEISQRNGMGNMKLQLASGDAMMKWKRKFKGFSKYVKLALTLVIGALQGDFINLFVHTTAALASG